MKKLCILLLLSLMATTRIFAQAQEIQQLILDIEKLAQFKQILSDMKKGYEIVSKGYNTVKDISKGSFNLHETFLDGLLQVSPAVRNYRKVADIIQYQLELVKEYKSAYNQFRHSNRFSPEELDYISGVYHDLLQESLKNIDELTMVITAGKLRMSDDERLEAIDRIYNDMQDKLAFLRSFNNSSKILSLQRAKQQQDIGTMQGLYGIKK